MRKAGSDRTATGVGSLVLLGFAISSTGGPLALAALYLVQSAHVAAPLLPAATVLGSLLFLAPLLVWYGYSRDIASAGGLSEFVRQAAGKRIALIQGLIWTLSYLLYLPFTVTYIVFYLLTATVPVSPLSLDAVQIALPVVLSLLVMAGRRLPLIVLGASAALQLVAIATLGVLVLPRTGLRLEALPAPSDAPSIISGAANVSLLFICVSLVLFLGEEADGGARAMRWTLSTAFTVAALFVCFAAVVLASSATPGVMAGKIPGFELAARYTAPPVALAIALLTIASIASLIIAEFVGLIRLWHALFGISYHRSTLAIAAFFVLGDAVSLLDPDRFYEAMLVPSLVALYVSQLLVFALYPGFGAHGRRPRLRDLAPALVASLLVLDGLYNVIRSPPAS